MMFRSLATTAIVLAAALAAPSADALAVKGQAKVYSDGDGAQLIIVPVDGNQALIKVTGTRSPWDGQVRLHTIDDLGNRGMDIWTNNGGRRYVTVTARSSYGSYKNYEFYLPGLGGDGVDVYFDEKKSGALDAQAVLSEYETQLKSRKPEPALLTDAQIAQQDFASLLASLMGEGMAEMRGKLKEATGHDVPLDIDWRTFNKFEALQRVQYVAMDRIVDGIKQAGGEDPKRQAAIRAGVKRVVLRHADQPPAKRITVTNGTLTVVGDYAGDNGYPSADDIAKVLEVVL